MSSDMIESLKLENVLEALNCTLSRLNNPSFLTIEQAQEAVIDTYKDAYYQGMKDVYEKIKSNPLPSFKTIIGRED